MRRVVLSVAVLFGMGLSVAVAAQQAAPSCEEQLKIVGVQAKEYYEDRDSKQREKIMLRASLQDAQIKIADLEKKIVELTKKPEPTKP